MSQNTEQSLFEILTHLGELQIDPEYDNEGAAHDDSDSYAAAPKVYEAKVSWKLPFTILKETLTLTPSDALGEKGSEELLLKATIGTSVPCDMTVTVGKRHKAQREYFNAGPRHEIEIAATRKDAHKGEIHVVIKITRADWDTAASAASSASASMSIELEKKGSGKEDREGYIVREITRLSIDVETKTVKVCGQEAVGSNGTKYVLEDFYDGEHCLICFDDDIDTACLPCRHLCLCSSCADMLRVNTGVCPVCRCGIASLIRICPDTQEDNNDSDDCDDDDDDDDDDD